MPKVTVFNLNVHPLHEMFKGDEVLIQANDYWRDKDGKIREIDIYEANDFKGQYHPVPFDGSGKMLEDSRYFKKIRMDKVQTEVDSEEEDTPAFKCMAAQCKHVSPSPEELTAHIKVRHPSEETLVLPEEDREIRAKNKAKKGKAA
jgi:hypothetical protein